MRLLFVTHSFPDFPASTRSKFILNLALILARRGHEVIVITPQLLRTSPLREDLAGVIVERFPFMTNQRPPATEPFAFIPAMSMLYKAWRDVRRAIKKYHPDIIHLHYLLPFGFMMGRLKGDIPLIVTSHGSDLLVWAKKGRIFRWLARKAIDAADLVTLTAAHMMESLLDLKKGGICEIIPMGFDGELFRPARGKEKIILSCRALMPVYDLETLIRACGKIKGDLSGWRVIIAGEGRLREKLVRLSSELGLEKTVEFVGAIPQAELAGLMSRASIYVSTSLSDGASGALLEAIAAGMFPVVSDIPANREWIEDGKDGRLFAPGDYLALAETLKWSINNYEDFYDVLKSKRKVVISKAEWNIVAERFIELYEKFSTAHG